MTSDNAYRLPGDRHYRDPGVLWGGYLADPVRFAIVVLSTLCLGYGARYDNKSPFTVWFLENIVGGIFSGVEVIMILLVVLEVVRRLAAGDIRLERSPMVAPMIGLGVIMGVYPTLAMFINEGRFRVPFEVCGHPLFVFCFFAFLFIFRRQELQVMVWMVLASGLFKAVEGILIFLQSGMLWGLLTGWRDGMLLSLMVLGAVIAFAVKPGNDRVYARMRQFLFWCLPLCTLAFIGSMRRSYILGVVLVLLGMFFAMRRQERRSFAGIAVVLIVLGVVSTMVVGAGGFLERIAGIYDPGSEGSAAYRVLESYNTWQMVLERPVFGWPYAVELRNYTNISVESLSTLAPHSAYLYVLLRAGIFGLASWLWLIAVMIRMNTRARRAARTPFERFVSLWLSCVPPLVIFTPCTTPVIADHMQEFLPFLVVMMGFLPGAWYRRRSAGSVSAVSGGGMDLP